MRDTSFEIHAAVLGFCLGFMITFIVSLLLSTCTGCATKNVGPEPPSRGVWSEPETAEMHGGAS